MTSTTSQMRRVAFSSFLGSVLEYYDFLLYATAAALVFGPVFFSGLDPVVGTLASLGTLATGYLARPLGGVVFGHFGDRIGRKRMLIVTMTIMGTVSVLIGLLPTPRQIGVLAPVLLVVLRLVQGFAIGGEWGGAVLMSAEHATTRRGLWATFTTAGGPSGALLSTLVLAGAAAVTTDEQFLAWGWRVPFLLSAVLLGVGLFVRAKVTESPVFEAALEHDEVEHAPPPLLDVLRNRPTQLLLSIGIGFGAFVLQSTYTAFAVSYAVAAGHQPRPVALNVLSLVSVAAIVGLLGFAAMSDRVGRRPVVLVGAAASGVFAFAVFPMMASGSVGLFALGLVVATLLQNVMGGPLSALYTELFSTRSRYTGASLGFQISSTGAGFAPLVFAALFAATGSSLVLSLVLAAGCLLSIGCVLAIPETSTVDLTDVAPATAGG